MLSLIAEEMMVTIRMTKNIPKIVSGMPKSEVMEFFAVGQAMTGTTASKVSPLDCVITCTLEVHEFIHHNSPSYFPSSPGTATMGSALGVPFRPADQ